MKSEDLIVDLSASLRPVRRLAPPWQRFSRWAIGALAITIAGMLCIGLRPSINTSIKDVQFLCLAVVTLAAALSSAFAALIVSIPAAERRQIQHWAPVAAAVTWGTLLICLLADGGAATTRLAAFPFHPLCPLEIAAFSIVPGVLLLSLVRRAAPLRTGWAALLVAVSAVSIGAVATQFLCPIDDPAHHLVAHYGPAVVFVAIATLFARARLRPTSVQPYSSTPRAS